MSATLRPYIDVNERFATLGVRPQPGLCILPRGFSDAGDPSTLRHESSALDLRTIMRSKGVSVSLCQIEEKQIPFIQENDDTWIGPVLFFSCSALTENPNLLAIAVNVISDHLSDLFRGATKPARAKLSVIIEKSETRTTKKVHKEITYDGPADQLSQIITLAMGVKDESRSG